MIEMTTNSTDHSSEIAPYSLLGRTWLATAKYANVKMPVDAIPIDRIRAPRAYPSAVRHRPRARRPTEMRRWRCWSRR